MIVQEVEGVDRIRVGGRWRHIRIQEDRGVGPGHPDGETVSVHGVPWLLPGVTEPGRASVIKAANTSSPAPTAGVAPLSTTFPSLPCAAAIWSSEPARATPE